MTAALPEFKTFILPGGHMAAAMAHVARAVCRRVERSMLDLRAAGILPAAGDDVAVALAYVNRLSDFLFVLARFINYQSGTGDVVWRG